MRTAGFMLLLALVVAGCTPAGEGVDQRPPPADARVWPAPPEPARIRFLYTFRSPQDLGLKAGFFDRLWEMVAGADDRGLIRPYAIAVRDSLIVVTDPGVGAVHRFDLKQRRYRRVIKVGKQRLRSPVGVALGHQHAYVADSALGTVISFGAKGDPAVLIADLQRPTGLAYDLDGRRLYVAETLRHRISVFDENGRPLFTFGQRGTGNGEFNYPTHLYLADGRLYVNDTMNFRVQVFDLEGTFLSAFGKHGDGSGDFAQPKGVGIDSEDHVYVADAVFDRVQIFDRSGKFLLAFGEHGTGAGGFWMPAGLTIANDRIYVADSYNRRVQVFEFVGGN